MTFMVNSQLQQVPPQISDLIPLGFFFRMRSTKESQPAFLLKPDAGAVTLDDFTTDSQQKRLGIRPSDGG
jgi:hypothetical protein